MDQRNGRGAVGGLRARARVTSFLLLAAIGYAVVGLVLFSSRDRIVFPIRGGGIAPPRDGELALIPVDGAVLKGWLLPGPERGPLLLWFHGNGETVLGLGSLLHEFKADGFALLAVDYRGYGGSTGKPTVANSERDALAIWDWIGARWPAVVVYGRSVGSGPAVALAAQRPVAGLILESPFTSLGAMARRSFPIFPSFLAGGGFDNLGRIGDVRAPVLIIHGDRDDMIPTRMSHLLYERVIERGGTAEEWVIAGAEHNSTYDVGDEEYVRRVREFVNRAVALTAGLPQSGPAPPRSSETPAERRDPR